MLLGILKKAWMILGLDYEGVLNKRPVAFRELAQSILDSGGAVHIISAVHEGNEDKQRRAVERSTVPYTQVEIIIYTHFNEVPRLKYEVAANLGLQLYIDDRKDTCHYLTKRGITSLQFDINK